MVTAQPRATVTGLTFALGLASLTADLLPVMVSRTTKSSGVSFTNVCPTCVEAHKVKQEFRCTHNPAHGPFGPNDTHKAIEGAAKTLTKVAAPAIEAVTTPPDERVSKYTDLGVYPAAQVEAVTFSAGTPYRLRPKKGTEEAYALFVHLASNPEVAFVCEVAPKKQAKLYRMIAQDGVLILDELCRPDEMYAPAPVVRDLDPRMIERADALVRFLIDDFDPEGFVDRRRARMDELRAAVTPVEVEAPTVTAKAAATDLLALLELSVAKSKAA